jgi:hypothetical protein
MIMATPDAYKVAVKKAKGMPLSIDTIEKFDLLLIFSVIL